MWVKGVDEASGDVLFKVDVGDDGGGGEGDRVKVSVVDCIGAGREDFKA